MTDRELLSLLRLLSALESWAMSVDKRFPDFLHEQLSEAMSVIEREILKGKE